MFINHRQTNKAQMKLSQYWFTD